MRGEKFSDHPTSTIILNNVQIPQITFSEARVNGEWIYTPDAISVVTAPIVPYQYDPDTDTWIKLDNNLGGNYARPFLMKKMVEQGTLDRKYYGAWSAAKNVKCK